MLYLIPTPIGNLKDITLRALEVLRRADVILCENPRHSLRLLQEYQIEKPLRQFNQHARFEKQAEIIEWVREGKEIAYISDAGMPGISDPGHELVAAAKEAHVPYTVLPGANAVLPALVVSGFLQKEFYFAGFLPLKKGRKKRLGELLLYSDPVALYESPYRINKFLEEMVLLGAGERQITIVRELTKLHEEYIHGTAAELLEKYKGHIWKGEFVIVLSSREVRRFEGDL